jgi:hypothetical protein
MFAPFAPDPECPICSGEGIKRNGCVVGRCECTNWGRYAELRRSKGLTMKQAMDELKDSNAVWSPDSCDRATRR